MTPAGTLVAVGALLVVCGLFGLQGLRALVTRWRRTDGVADAVSAWQGRPGEDEVRESVAETVHGTLDREVEDFVERNDGKRNDGRKQKILDRVEAPKVREDIWSVLTSHRRTLAAVTVAASPLLAIAMDVLEYRHFNFDVLAHYSAAALPTVMVGAVTLAFTAALVVLALIALTLLAALAGVLRLLVNAAFAAATGLVRLRRRLLGLLVSSCFFCCRWTRFARLTVGFLAGLVQTPDASAARGKSTVQQGQGEDDREAQRRRDEKQKREERRKKVRAVVWKTGVAVVYLGVLGIVGLIEAQYRAYATCFGPVMAVVDPAVETELLSPMHIGAQGGLVFLASVDSCGHAEKSGARRIGLTVPAPPATVLASAAAEGSLREPGNAAADRAPLGLLRSLLGSRIDFIKCADWPNVANLNADHKFPSQVVVLPLNRIYCLYEAARSAANGSSKAPCSVAPREPPPPPPPSADDELLRKDLAQLVECDDTLRMSQPFVFPPHASEAAGDNGRVGRWAAEFLRQLEDDAPPAAVYVFGFASADGDADYNEELSRRRVDAVHAPVRQAVGGVEWHGSTPVVKKKPRGEFHLTGGVAASRSVRLAACVRVAGEPAGDE